MKITKKSQLIELLSGVQVACLTLGLLCCAFWVRAEVQGIVREQIMSDNQLIATQMAKLIDLKNLATVEYKSDGWDKLQTLVEDITLPNNGYMCVVDTDGSMLCHPKMRSNPELRKTGIHDWSVQLADAGQRPLSGLDALEAATGAPVTGTLGRGNASEVVSIFPLANLSSTLFVHQSERGFRRAVNSLLLPIGGICLIVGLGLILLTTKASTGVLSIYENKLADINEHLEVLVSKRTRSLMKTRNSVIFGLAKLAESRDTDTGHHLERIRCYVTILAKNLANENTRLDDVYVADLALASSLHDVGKVGIPDHILMKPGGLTPEEREVMNRHATIGGDCLHAIQEHLGEDDFLALATEIAYFHHERWDGAGYPFNRSGEEIPLSARITALADVYDALTSKRPYKDAMSHDKAKQIILEGSGSHFDPRIVEAFCNAEQEFREIASKNGSESVATPGCPTGPSLNDSIPDAPLIAASHA